MNKAALLALVKEIKIKLNECSITASFVEKGPESKNLESVDNSFFFRRENPLVKKRFIPKQEDLWESNREIIMQKLFPDEFSLLKTGSVHFRGDIFLGQIELLALVHEKRLDPSKYLTLGTLKIKFRQERITTIQITDEAGWENGLILFSKMIKTTTEAKTAPKWKNLMRC